MNASTAPAGGSFTVHQQGGALTQCASREALWEPAQPACNDRHCPQCGGTDADDWLQRQKQRLLLPVPYFLVTFTVPEELRHLIRSNQKITLDLLFAAVARRRTKI